MFIQVHKIYIYVLELISGWWLLADVLRVMPSKAIEFTAFDAYKKVLCKRDPVTGMYSYGHGSSALAGGAAGACVSVRLKPSF